MIDINKERENQEEIMNIIIQNITKKEIEKKTEIDTMTDIINIQAEIIVIKIIIEIEIEIIKVVEEKEILIEKEETMITIIAMAVVHVINIVVHVPARDQKTNPPHQEKKENIIVLLLIDQKIRINLIGMK